MNTTDPVFQVDHLSLAYPGRKGQPPVQILKDVSFAVDRGSALTLVGPSGAGKSTLLRCLNRLEEPTRGTIRFAGTDILSPRVDMNVIRRQMGMVFQSFNLYPHMTALGNVSLALQKVLVAFRNE